MVTGLNRAFFLMVLAVFMPLAYSSVTITANCSHITVITDVSNAYVDIQYQVGSAWQSIYSMENVDSSGRAFFETLYNGTHRAAVRDSPGAFDEYSATIEITTCAPEIPCSSNSDCDTGTVCVNTKCVPGDCTSDSDCPNDRYCQPTHTCALVQCVCGQVSNHVCNKFECCSDSACSDGKVCKSNTCVAPDAPPPPPPQNNQQNQTQNQTQQNTNTGIQNQTKLGGTTSSGSEIGLYCMGGVALLFVFVIVLFLIIALVAAFYKKGK